MKKSKPLIALTAVAALGLGVAGLAPGAGQKTTTQLKATLNVGQEVPKPTGTKPGETGLFTATLTQNGSATLKWKLTFRRLTGAATAAHIHLGKSGKTGAVVIPLCSPCRSGASGTASPSPAVVKALLKAGAYVNVHTAKNPGGEVRGQVTKAAAGGRYGY